MNINRRKVRASLGSRTVRRAGSKRRGKGGKKPTKARPRVALEREIRKIKRGES